MGLLPSHRMPTEEEWEASGYTRAGWPVIGPAESVRDHPGFDRVVVLAISPQLLEGRLIGTVDATDLLGVEARSIPTSVTTRSRPSCAATRTGSSDSRR